MELGSYFLFLQEQIKDIIISRSTEHPKTDGDTAVTNVRRINGGSGCVAFSRGTQLLCVCLLLLCVCLSLPKCCVVAGVCVYYCRDMCYERLRAEAGVN